MSTRDMIDTLLADVTSPEFRHLLAKCREARDGAGYLSSGERLAAALVLDRVDWLAEEKYTIVEAIDRVGPTWVALMPDIVRALKAEHEERVERGDPSCADDWWAPPLAARRVDPAERSEGDERSRPPG